MYSPEHIDSDIAVRIDPWMVSACRYGFIEDGSGNRRGCPNQLVDAPKPLDDQTMVLMSEYWRIWKELAIRKSWSTALNVFSESSFI